MSKKSDTKNIIYIKKVLFLLIVVSAWSCKTTKKVVVDSAEERYVMAYKSSVLYGCLNEATRGGFQVVMTEKNDVGLAVESEMLGPIKISELCQFGGDFSRKITPIDYADYENMSPIYTNCVSFSFSREVDSIARQQYKMAKNSTMEYSE